VLWRAAWDRTPQQARSRVVHHLPHRSVCTCKLRSARCVSPRDRDRGPQTPPKGISTAPHIYGGLAEVTSTAARLARTFGCVWPAVSTTRSRATGATQEQISAHNITQCRLLLPAIGFASRNVKIRTELEKRVLACSVPCRANRFELMGMISELPGAVLPIPPRGPSSIYMQEPPLEYHAHIYLELLSSWRLATGKAKRAPKLLASDQQQNLQGLAGTSFVTSYA
jgi:hypothetical protein